MKFKVIGTKTTLEPADEFVIKTYASQPDLYEPADTAAKKATAEIIGENNAPGGDSGGSGSE